MPHWHDQQNGMASLLTVPIPSCRGSTVAQVLESGDPSVKRVFTACPGLDPLLLPPSPDLSPCPESLPTSLPLGWCPARPRAPLPGS